MAPRKGRNLVAQASSLCHQGLSCDQGGGFVGEMKKGRRSIRLKEFNYDQPGAYFVTICTKNRDSLLGSIKEGQLIKNDIGRAIQTAWEDLPKRFPEAALDAFIVMPNHIHGIIIVGAQFIAPTEGVINHAPTLGEIVRTFKAMSTRRIREEIYPHFFWQRNYYEHVIRDEKSLNRIREYIITNPLRWSLDRENPHAKGRDKFDLWLASFKTKPDKAINI